MHEVVNMIKTLVFYGADINKMNSNGLNTIQSVFRVLLHLPPQMQEQWDSLIDTLLGLEPNTEVDIDEKNIQRLKIKVDLNRKFE